MASLKLVRAPISRVSFDSWFQAICLREKLTQRERDKNTVVTLSVRLHNCKGCLRPFANIVQTAFKDFFYKFLNSACKSRASLIHLNN